MPRFRRLKAASVVTICCLIVIIVKSRKKSKNYLVDMDIEPIILTEEPVLENEVEDESAMCPWKPPEIDLEDFHPINLTLTTPPPVLDLFKILAPGGNYKPNNCVSWTKTAIIVPYRRRERHLAVFLNHLVPFLIRQQAEFTIFIIELMPEVTFNRALLLNIGFVEAMRTRNFTCIILHDVDLLPESDSNLYRCGDYPRHMAVALSAFQYQCLVHIVNPQDAAHSTAPGPDAARSTSDGSTGVVPKTLPYYLNAGGVLAIKPETFRSVNGLSNLYFGWGGEDDDLLYRLTWMGHAVSRYPANISRYTAIFHTRDSGNKDGDLRYRLLWTVKTRMFEDGLSSLRYRRVSYNQLPLYTRILVDVDMADYT